MIKYMVVRNHCEYNDESYNYTDGFVQLMKPFLNKDEAESYRYQLDIKDILHTNLLDDSLDITSRFCSEFYCDLDMLLEAFNCKDLDSLNDYMSSAGIKGIFTKDKFIFNTITKEIVSDLYNGNILQSEFSIAQYEE